MTKINPNFITKIKEKFSADNDVYLKIKLDISKTFFAISASLYFFCYLSTIAGFQVELLGKMLVGIYPIFIFSILALIYDLLIYLANTHTEKVKSIKIPLLTVLALIYALLLAVFFGLKI